MKACQEKRSTRSSYSTADCIKHSRGAARSRSGGERKERKRCFASLTSRRTAPMLDTVMVEVTRCAPTADTFSSVLRIATRIVHFELILTDSCVGVIA